MRVRESTEKIMPVTQLELQNFTEYVTEQIADDNAPSLEQCLNRWRAEREREVTIASGRGRRRCRSRSFTGRSG